jgi:hypothetical protein
MDALSTGSPFERVVLMKGAQSPNLQQVPEIRRGIGAIPILRLAAPEAPPNRSRATGEAEIVAMFAIVRRRLRVAFAEAKLHEGQSQACSQHRNQHLHVAHLAAKHSAVENKAGRRAAEGHFENEACAGYQAECKESWNAPIIGGDIFTAEVNLLGNSRGMSVMGQ